MSLATAKKRILICEDTPDLCILMTRILEGRGFLTTVTSKGSQCINTYQKSDFDLVLLDVGLPDMSGLDILKTLRKDTPKLPIIMITAYTSIETAVEAMRLGATNYLAKPFDVDKLIAAVEDALIQADPNQMDTMVRDSEKSALNPIIDIIDKLSHMDVSLLIHGESGTGKELIAHYAHQVSQRHKGPLIPVNCPAVPPNLFESEMFGHEKGAFTGATHTKEGKIAQAHKGILFLDEVADLKASEQAKLLRVIQEREIEPLGGKRRKVDFQVFAATSQNLRELVAQDLFRLDLYYRLAEVEVTVPALRQRPEDIPILAEHFNQTMSHELNIPSLQLTPNVIKELQAYSWPGNIRELQSAIRRLMILTPKGQELKHIPAGILLPIAAPHSMTAESAPTEFSNSGLDIHSHEKALIEQALRESDHNISQAAKKLHMGRTTLYRKIKKYKISA